jgi:hypothetical protein
VSASEHHPLDDLAKGLASGTISRRRALKLIVTAVAGATLALIPGVASASPPPHARSDLAPPKHAQDQEGFEPGTGGRFGSEETCSGGCSSDSDCAPGCECQFFVEEGFFACISSSALRGSNCTFVANCNNCPSSCACVCAPECDAFQCCC